MHHKGKLSIYIYAAIDYSFRHFLAGAVLWNLAMAHYIVNMCLPHQQMTCLHLTGKSLHTLRIRTDDIFNDYYLVIVLNITNNKKKRHTFQVQYYGILLFDNRRTILTNMFNKRIYISTIHFFLEY